MSPHQLSGYGACKVKGSAKKPSDQVNSESGEQIEANPKRNHHCRRRRANDFWPIACRALRAARIRRLMSAGRRR